MQDLTEFQQRAVVLAVVKMLNGRYFSVSDLRVIAQAIGREQALSGSDFLALRVLHCVDWVEMGPDLARLTRGKCLDLLGLPPQTIDMIAPERPADRTSEPAKRMRLAFWRAA